MEVQQLRPKWMEKSEASARREASDADTVEDERFVLVATVELLVVRETVVDCDSQQSREANAGSRSR